MQTEQLKSLIAVREDLDAQRQTIDEKIKAAQYAARREVFKTAAQAFALHGITREEVVAHFSKTNSTAGTKVPPKFRHKATGQTWSGRGKAPKWYADVLCQSEIERLEGGAA